MTREELVRESALQAAHGWRAMAAPIAEATLAEEGPLLVSLGNVPHFVLNSIGVTEPITAERLPGVVREAKRLAAGCPAPWMLTCCEDWLPDGAEAILAQEALAPVMRTTGMVAGSLAPPRRPVPSELRIDTTVDAGMVAKLFDVNSHAYGMPLELGQASIRPGLFTNAWCAVGHIDDEPVSVAVTFRVGECLYVAWVATMPARQGRGYAEAVMRRTLADAGAATGLSRTVLHASAAGQPLYAMMGYEPVTAVTFYGHGFEH